MSSRSPRGTGLIRVSVLLCAVFFARGAGAEHYDMLYGLDDGHLKTGATDFDALELLSDVRVFSNTFTFNAGQGGLWTDDPGHTSHDSPPGMDGLPEGAALSFDIAVEPLTGRNLSYWDGDTYPISWGAVPSGETIEISFGSDLAIADGGSARVPGFLIDTEPGSGGIHTHPDYHLRPTQSAAEGIYLLALEASLDPVSPADAAAPSPRFWIVFRYGESSADWDAAVEWVETHLAVPDCQDGFDNDGDGLIDSDGGSLGAGHEDLGCDGPLDESEFSPALVCDDGIDRDGDGLADFPDDPGCASPTDLLEGGFCADLEGTEKLTVPKVKSKKRDLSLRVCVDEDGAWEMTESKGGQVLDAGSTEPVGTTGRRWRLVGADPVLGQLSKYAPGEHPRIKVKVLDEPKWTIWLDKAGDTLEAKGKYEVKGRKKGKRAQKGSFVARLAGEVDEEAP
ncbi:MAG: hypothetical protein ACQGVK_05645 [Myxococcota bacterium]